MIAPEVYREMGLNDAEYQQIEAILGREPTETELGMFAVMWSEHCGYKYSRPVLALFKTYKEAQEKGALENAGVIPLDDKLGIVFKIESHNHPSAVEPFQGAATGVGGILRDIFTMGARPIANLNSLRFGPIDSGKDAVRNRYLFEGVVDGIAHYGNCLEGSETLVWRDAVGVHFDTIGGFVESCLHQGQSATSLDPENPVEILSFNDETLEPCWKAMKRVFKRQSRQLLRIKTALGRTLTVTPDHPMLVWHEGQWQYRLAQTLKNEEQIPLLTRMPSSAIQEKEEVSNLDFIQMLQAEGITNAFVALPKGWKPTAEVREALRELDSSASRRCQYLTAGAFPLALFIKLEPLLNVDRRDVYLFRKGKANRMRAVVQPNERFARLLGYYLSEGCVSANGNTFKIILTFALHEREYVHDTMEALASLGLRVSVEERGSTVAVYATSWLLGHALKSVWECGADATSKALPTFVFQWPRHLQREVLKGLLRGDGSLTTLTHGSHAKITYATASRRLFDQAVALVQNEGAIPSIYQRASRSGSIQGRQVDCAPLWILEVCSMAGLAALADVFGEERNQQLATALSHYQGAKYSFPRYRFINDDEGVALVKIKSIETREASSGETFDVYDVEVEGTHLFATTSGLITHNCVGVPTVAGEVVFNECYSGNPLVNAMAVGVVELDRIASAAAKGVGNPVLYVGSSTGKDGIHGATFASVELGPDSESKRPNVQMGDPFMEKLLIEATLEALATGDIAGIQDMGAAGLTCGTCETASKAGNGMEIDVLKVPRREADMNPYEIMLSESQERMLAICHKGTEERVAGIFRKWGLNAVVIGHVTGDGMVRIMEGERVAAEIPAKALTDECPVYQLDAAEPDYIARVQSFDPLSLPEPDDYNKVLHRLLASPTIASKEWVTTQYDSMVQTQTVIGPGDGDAAILRIRGTEKGIAVKIDGNGRYCYLDPYVGGLIAVAEAARNVVCVGGRPAAVTDNLNFANPEKPTGFWQFRRAVEGLAKATEVFGTPVVSGNVSFYNETPEGPIFPTPTIGMLGILDNVNRRCGSALRGEEGDVLVLLRADNDPSGALGGSEYLQVIHGKQEGRPPAIDLAAEKRLQDCVLTGIQDGLFASAHDCAEGGLMVCLAECAMAANVGVALLLRAADFNNLPPSAILFGEAQSRILVSLRNEKQLKQLERMADLHGIRAQWIGSVGGENLRVTLDGKDLLNEPIAALGRSYTGSIRHIMEGERSV